LFQEKKLRKLFLVMVFRSDETKLSFEEVLELIGECDLPDWIKLAQSDPPKIRFRDSNRHRDFLEFIDDWGEMLYNTERNDDSLCVQIVSQRTLNAAHEVSNQKVLVGDEAVEARGSAFHCDVGCSPNELARPARN